MKLHLYFLACLFVSCSTPSITAPDLTTTTPTTNAATAATAPATAQPTVLQEVTEQHLFSNRTKPDQFRLQLIGKDVLTGTVHLSIVSASGDTLWSERFVATSLYTSDAPAPSEKTQEAYITDRINSFFTKEKFLSAAVAQNAKFDADYNSNQQLWTEAKKQALPGFEYLLGDEDQRILAYSAKMNKAVVVFNCC